MNNKLPYFLVALCLCMFCAFTAYADDAPPAEDSTQTAAEEETTETETGAENDITKSQNTETNGANAG